MKLPPGARAAAMARAPNFLLFVTDQHRADHLGCYGDPDVRTPHIDALAGRGCRFTQFHVATPICQPNVALLIHRLRWVSCTPFGRAVVPDV